MTMSSHNGVMKDVKIADLKSRLSHYLRQVRAGETVTVLDRNTPVARLVPVDSGDDIVITKPAPNAPSLASLKLPKPPKIDVDIVSVLLEDRRRR
jgi:prevent-host-death family protein